MNNQSSFSCVVCNLIPVFISGIVGYWGGLLSLKLGLDHTFASTFAGFCGFMAVQAVQLMCSMVAHYFKGDSYVESK